MSQHAEQTKSRVNNVTLQMNRDIAPIGDAPVLLHALNGRLLNPFGSGNIPEVLPPGHVVLPVELSRIPGGVLNHLVDKDHRGLENGINFQLSIAAPVAAFRPGKRSPVRAFLVLFHRIIALSDPAQGT